MLNQGQAAAMELLNGRENIFLTGAAGSGKSYVLREWLDGQFSDIPILASTGAAAILIGGRTFHGFFGLGILEGGVEATVTRALDNSWLRRRMSRSNTIVIDEISMISGPLLDAAERIAREARSAMRPDLAGIPWGGMRVIVVGDFSQLPPVNRFSKEREWAFKHDVWKRSKFKPIMLKEVMRTQDPEFLEVLNKLRIGKLDVPTMNWLSALSKKKSTPNILRLFSHKTDTEKYNLDMLAQIPHELKSFDTSYSPDNEQLVQRHGKDFPIPRKFQVKQDALVMFRTNDPQGRWVNGSLGTVLEFETNDFDGTRIWVQVERTKEEIPVKPHRFECLDKDGEPVLSAENFPLTLAWASTIHKAQGLTVDRMTTDATRLWEPGQAYVALSRCRSAEGLFLEGWNAKSIFADKEVLKFYEGIQ